MLGALEQEVPLQGSPILFSGTVGLIMGPQEPMEGGE